MPVIPVSGPEWDDLFKATSFLWLDPSSAEFHEPLTEAIEGQILLTLTQRFGAKHFKIDDEAIDLFSKAQAFGGIDAEKAEFDPGAFVAGDLLLTVLRLSIYLPEKASLENAIRIVGAREKKAGRKCSRASLMKTWTRYRSVSHLAAAVAVSLPTFRAMARGLKTFAQAKRLSVPERKDEITARMMKRFAKELTRRLAALQLTLRRQVPRFFAKAERLRQLGERHYSFSQKKQRKRLLDPALMWTVPPEFKLPHVRLTLPRLTADERALF